jgi:hypothetical protein
MKKTFILFFMLLMPFCISKVNAETVMHQTNYLDLTNLFVSDDGNFLANTIEPIHVEKEETYTLVFGYDFLGQYVFYLDYCEITVVEEDQSEHYYAFIQDDLMNRAYIEFIPTTNQIHLLDLPVAPFNDEAILYKGNYLSFDGFEPYHQNHLIDQGTLYIDYGSSITSAFIEENIIAKDPFGNEIETYIVSNGFNNNTSELGTYQMVLEAQYNDVKKQYVLDIIIVDREAPQMTINEPLHFSLQDKPSLQEILLMISLQDNVDTLTHEDIMIINDTYSQASVPGTYEIQVEVFDYSQNRAEITIPIYLYNLSGPTIEGPAIIFVYTSQEPLSNDDIINHFVINQNNLDQIVVEVILNQYSQTKIPGIYNFRFRATDQNNNVKEKLVHIHVIENRAPTFEFNELLIEMNVNHVMSNQELIQWFENTLKNQGFEIGQIEIVYNPYEQANYKAGTYLIDFKYEINGEEHFTKATLIVNESFLNTEKLIYSISALLLLVVVGFYAIKKKKR